MGKSGPKDKSFAIPKQLVWEAYEQVRRNKGAAGVDGVSIDDFEADLRNNLYKIWNRMSSGTYFPPPVKAVEIPKPHGKGTGMLGVPTSRTESRKQGWHWRLKAERSRSSIPTPTATGPGSYHSMR